MKKQLLTCATILGFGVAPFVVSAEPPPQPTAEAGRLIAEYMGWNPSAGGYYGAYVGYVYVKVTGVPYLTVLVSAL